MSEVRFFRECETCEGGGLIGEDRPGHVTEFVGCEDCRGTGAGAEVRMVQVLAIPVKKGGVFLGNATYLWREVGDE